MYHYKKGHVKKDMSLSMSDYNELHFNRQLHRTMVGAEDVVMDAGTT